MLGFLLGDKVSLLSGICKDVARFERRKTLLSVQRCCIFFWDLHGGSPAYEMLGNDDNGCNPSDLRQKVAK